MCFYWFVLLYAAQSHTREMGGSINLINKWNKQKLHSLHLTSTVYGSHYCSPSVLNREQQRKKFSFKVKYGTPLHIRPMKFHKSYFGFAFCLYEQVESFWILYEILYIITTLPCRFFFSGSSLVKSHYLFIYLNLYYQLHHSHNFGLLVKEQTPSPPQTKNSINT